MKLILCSRSERRRELIKKLKLPYVTVDADIDENIDAANPETLVTRLALMKAAAGSLGLSRGIALGADTIVVDRNGKIIGKPVDPRDAERILRMLSGTVHTVYTGVALTDCSNGRTVVDFEKTRVKMRKLSRAEISSYATKHLDKAGSYAVQEKGDAVVEKIYGDYYNVVGLPLAKIRKMLRFFR